MNGNDKKIVTKIWEKVASMKEERLGSLNRRKGNIHYRKLLIIEDPTKLLNLENVKKYQ